MRKSMPRAAHRKEAINEDNEVDNEVDKEVDNERAISSFVAICRKELENGYTYDRCETAKIIAGTKLIQVDG